MPVEAVDPLHQSACEAINSLGYVNGSAVEWLVSSIPQCAYQGAAALATKFRKQGNQLSADDKKALGIRANGFFSDEALGHLTEQGRGIAIKAHEITLLRAHFTHLRFRRLAEYRSIEVQSVVWDGFFRSECSACAMLHGKVIPISEADPSPPLGCAKDGCAISFLAKIDYDSEWFGGGISFL